MLTKAKQDISLIGLPRALFYYAHVHMWETFLCSLGYEVVLSDITSSRTVKLAGAISEAEHCLPMKLLDAHLADLQGRVDAVLVPRYHSGMPGYIACPKMGAMPDVAAIRTDTPVLSCVVDLRKSSLDATLKRFGRSLGFGGKVARRAAAQALDALSEGRRRRLSAPDGDTPRVLLLGHPYNIRDEYLSGPVVRTLHRLGVSVEMMPYGDTENPIPLHKPAPENGGFIRWDTSREMMEAIRTADPNRIMGIIHMSSFNCGCDSVLIDIYRREASAAGIPYMVLMFDEHTGRAGIETRIEAFVDSIRWTREAAPHGGGGRNSQEAHDSGA